MVPTPQVSMRPLARFALAALVAAGGAFFAPATAQAPIVWEPLPGFRSFGANHAYAIVFVREGEGFAPFVSDGEIRRWDEAAGAWEDLCTRTFCFAQTMAVRDSVIMGGQPTGPGHGGALSLDGGRTWIERPFDSPTSDSIDDLLWSTHPGTDGSLYVGSTFRLHRSDGLGRPGTYVELGLTGGLIEAIAEVPPSASLPSGRLLAGVWNGISYSDDGGETFQSSSLYQQGGLIGNSFALVPDPQHPFGAVVFASVELAHTEGFPHGLYRSDDGGATWTEVNRIERGDFGVADPDDVQLLATSDGVIWAGVFDGIGGQPTDVGVVLRSEDGGQTLEVAGTGYGNYGVRALAEAPDGRVYVASDSLVWRTVEPVVAVAEEPTPPEASDLTLTIEPNPTTHLATARWRVRRAGAARVSVFDARGREVLVVAEGHRQSGEQAVEVDTSGLAPGVYVVRIATAEGTARASFTVAR